VAEEKLPLRFFRGIPKALSEYLRSKPWKIRGEFFQPLEKMKSKVQTLESVYSKQGRRDGGDTYRRRPACKYRKLSDISPNLRAGARSIRHNMIIRRERVSDENNQTPVFVDQHATSHNISYQHSVFCGFLVDKWLLVDSYPQQRKRRRMECWNTGKLDCGTDLTIELHGNSLAKIWRRFSYAQKSNPLQCGTGCSRIFLFFVRKITA